MRAIMVSVDYHDFLNLTLPANHRQFDTITVITSPSYYTPTAKVCYPYSNVKVLVTDLFYRDGARFNKGRAIEWGLDQIGRGGWLAVMDADIIIPSCVNLKDVECKGMRVGYLYTPLRHLLDPIPIVRGEVFIPEEKDWRHIPVHMQLREWAGYLHMFHGSSECLGNPPWYPIDWKMANGYDSELQAKFGERKVRPSWNVLHLGSHGTDWAGRATPYIDPDRRGVSHPESVQRIGELRNMIRKRGSGSDRFRHEKIDIASHLDSHQGVITSTIDSETPKPTETGHLPPSS